MNIEGATVQITALSGVFDSSGDVVATLNTDSSGLAVFTWITTDMTVTSKTDYTFDIQATLPGYDTSDLEQILVEVNPVATEPTTPTGDGLTQNQMLGILFGAVGGLLVIGTVSYMILRKKPVP